VGPPDLGPFGAARLVWEMGNDGDATELVYDGIDKCCAARVLEYHIRLGTDEGRLSLKHSGAEAGSPFTLTWHS
jgi:hypothetical protein